MEHWKMEYCKVERLEYWNIGRLENRKIGKSENRKIGTSFHYSTIPSFRVFTFRLSIIPILQYPNTPRALCFLC
jgi:hypothetical protein